MSLLLSLSLSSPVASVLASTEKNAQSNAEPCASMEVRFSNGTKVRKYFPGHGYFVGQVVSYDAEEQFYAIDYTDGDQEEMDHAEVIKFHKNYIRWEEKETSSRLQKNAAAAAAAATARRREVVVPPNDVHVLDTSSSSSNPTTNDVAAEATTTNLLRRRSLRVHPQKSYKASLISCSRSNNNIPMELSRSTKEEVQKNEDSIKTDPLSIPQTDRVVSSSSSSSLSSSSVQPKKRPNSPMDNHNVTYASVETKKAKKDNLCLWRLHDLEPSKVIQNLSLPLVPSYPFDHSQDSSCQRSSGKNRIQMVDFFLFVYERQCIWKRRNQGQSEPFSRNVIFNDYYFCNNYRELDRGTAFFHSHILDLYYDNNNNNDHGIDWNQLEWTQTVLWASYCYRQVNRIESFMALGFPKTNTIASFIRGAKDIRHAGKSFFTAAHQTTNIVAYESYLKQVVAEKEALLKQVARDILLARSQGAATDAPWEMNCLAAIRRLPGVGPFLSWQIFCDLKESRCFSDSRIMPTSSSHDSDDGERDNDYAELGPGAKKGLELIFHLKKPSTSTYLALAKELVRSQDDIYRALGLEFPRWNNRALSMKEIEHALCEYSKFKRIQAELGKGGQQCAVIGMRRRVSNASLDDDKDCSMCNTCQENGILCDTCLNFFCQSCIPSIVTTATSNVSWTCARCDAFASVCF